MRDKNEKPAASIKDEADGDVPSEGLPVDSPTRLYTVEITLEE